MREKILGRHYITDTLLTIILVCGATSVSMMFVKLDGDDSYTSLIFVLAVFIISWKTGGYIYGLGASIAGVIAVNYYFTYPYSAMNFSITGYPITFIVFLLVAVCTCTLTLQAKQSEFLRSENEKEKMRADLLRSVSHDLRTPLTSIVGATNTMLSDPDMDPEERRQMLIDVRDESEWLVHMVENLLTVTRISSSTKIKKELWAVEEVIGEAAGKVRNQYPDILVEIRIPDEVLFVPMDPVLIEQVLLNLMNNAIRHGHGTSAIVVTVQHEQNDCRFTVTDDGGGFKEEYLTHLFDRSFMESQRTEGKDSDKFIGIGLSACKAIVKAHDGTITARNVMAQDSSGVVGAEVSFVLPLEHGSNV